MASSYRPHETSPSPPKSTGKPVLYIDGYALPEEFNDRQTEIEIERERQRGTEIDRMRHEEGMRDKERQTDIERDSEQQR